MNGTHFTANKFALIGLALSCIGLLTYAGISARVSFVFFAIATAGVWLGSVVAFALAIGARGARKPLARVSIVVACGYLIVMSIVLLNVIVAWLRG